MLCSSITFHCTPAAAQQTFQSGILAQQGPNLISRLKLAIRLLNAQIGNKIVQMVVVQFIVATGFDQNVPVFEIVTRIFHVQL